MLTHFSSDTYPEIRVICASLARNQQPLILGLLLRVGSDFIGIKRRQLRFPRDAILGSGSLPSVIEFVYFDWLYSLTKINGCDSVSGDGVLRWLR
jgi:hypothetical protein